MFGLKDRNTAGTDLNLAFMTILERMALIKARVKEEAFKEHRHVIILFTDGKSSLWLYFFYLLVCVYAHIIIFNILILFVAGAYNMGGTPMPTVAKIKNMVYMNHTGNQEAQSREDYLGEL